MQSYKGHGPLKPIGSTFEEIYFPSYWELRVYQAIRLCVPKNRVICHSEIPLIPESPQFLAMTWAVDFVVLSPDTTKRLYIEAKGIRTEDFLLKLRVVNHLRPEVVQNLLIVTSKPGLRYGRIIKSQSIMQVIKMLSVLEATEWTLKPR